VATLLFLGARLDGDVVLLDRRAGRLIRLEAGGPRLESVSARHRRQRALPARILAELERAGLVRRDGGAYMRTPVEMDPSGTGERAFVAEGGALTCLRGPRRMTGPVEALFTPVAVPSEPLPAVEVMIAHDGRHATSRVNGNEL